MGAVTADSLYRAIDAFRINEPAHFVGLERLAGMARGAGFGEHLHAGYGFCVRRIKSHFTGIKKRQIFIAFIK